MMTLKTKSKPLLRDEIRKRIIRMIIENGIAKGGRLPPEKELGKLLNVNHLTVRSACSELVEKNVLYKIPGHGTFFNEFPKAEKNVSGQVVGILMMDEEHFFNLARNQIIENLQQVNCLCRISALTGQETKSILPEIKSMLSYGVEHLVIMQTELEKFPDAVRFLNENKQHFHSIVRIFGNGSGEGDFPGCNITPDYKQAFRLRIERLKGAGLKRIAYLGNNCSPDYLAGKANRKFISIYSDAMIEAGLERYIMARSSAEDPAELHALLTGADRPEAIICSTDYLAMKVNEAAREHGLKIPDDISVIGTYDTPWAQHFNLASLRFDTKKFAAAVSNAVISGKDSGTEWIGFELVERSSIPVLINRKEERS